MSNARFGSGSRFTSKANQSTAEGLAARGIPTKDADTASADKASKSDDAKADNVKAAQSKATQSKATDNGKRADTKPVNDAQQSERERGKTPTKQSEQGRPGGAKGSKSSGKGAADAIRNGIAALVWLVAVLAAVVLAVGALLAALDANPDNSIVDFFRALAHNIDGPFWNVVTFDGDNARTKELVVNWGLAAVAYLIVGKILDRIIRP